MAHGYTGAGAFGLAPPISDLQPQRVSSYVPGNFAAGPPYSECSAVQAGTAPQSAAALPFSSPLAQAAGTFAGGTSHVPVTSLDTPQLTPGQHWSTDTTNAPAAALQSSTEHCPASAQAPPELSKTANSAEDGNFHTARSSSDTIVPAEDAMLKPARREISLQGGFPPRKHVSRAHSPCTPSRGSAEAGMHSAMDIHGRRRSGTSTDSGKGSLCGEWVTQFGTSSLSISRAASVSELSDVGTLCAAEATSTGTPSFTVRSAHV